MRYTWMGCLLCLMATGWLSCKKMLDVDSTRAVTEENMWKTKNDAWAGSFACYGLLRAAMSNENAYWAYGEMRAGDFAVTKRGDLKALRANELTANYAAMDAWRDWRKFYAAIAQCNLALTKLEGIPALDARYSRAEMKLDMAQVRFVRALTYWYIVRVWGDVPLITEPTTGEFKPVARENREKVLQFALQEALAAAEDLPWQFDGTDPEAPGNYRGQGISHWRSILATRGACYTLAAHIAALLKDYQGSLKYINIVMDNKAQTGYAYCTNNEYLTLGSGGNATFRGRVNWNIFQLDFNFDHAEYSTTGTLEYWTLRYPDVPKTEAEIYVMKDSILTIYPDVSDVRSVLFFTDVTAMQPMFYKIKMMDPAVKNPNLRMFNSCIIIFRYEELTLLRAECNARLGKEADARTEVNTLKAYRFAAPLTDDYTGEALLDAILEERRRELIGEGWRWFDLVSFGKVPAFTNISEADVNMGAEYWPLSKSALSLNSLLTQNTFWK
ncbi:RagB/SusD family nutrient uptake outer membrane protein [Chitinophaga lutea]